MNKTEIKEELDRACKFLNEADGNIHVAKDIIEQVKSEMQESFDNHSDKWQESDKGQEYQDRITELEAVVEKLDGFIDQIVNDVNSTIE